MNDIRPTRQIVEESIEGSRRHLVLDYDHAVNFIAGDTTPSVANLTRFKANGIVTITDFDHGSEGQRIHILGDGNTTVDHNTNIKRSGGIAAVLAADKIYNFVSIGGVWYEDSGGGGGAPAAHATTHQNGGTDEINVAGLSGELADPQPPKAHAASHADAGADPVNVTGLDGFPGGTATFLRADGTFATPSAGGGSVDIEPALFYTFQMI